MARFSYNNSLMSRYVAACVAPLVLGVSGCGGKDCAGIGLTRTTPSEVTIAVSQSVTLQYQEGGYCFGEAPTEADYRPAPTHWTTGDTVVVALDSITGMVTGRRSGDARVSPTNALALSVLVHVR